MGRITRVGQRGRFRPTPFPDRWGVPRHGGKRRVPGYRFTPDTPAEKAWERAKEKELRLLAQRWESIGSAFIGLVIGGALLWLIFETLTSR